MSLSVTSASPSALAILQALSPQTSSRQAASTGVAAAASSLTTPSQSSVSASASASGAVSLFTVADGVGQALSAADSADAAGQSVLGLLQQMRTAAGQAADPSASASDRLGLDRQFQTSARQIAPTLSGATVNGVNLVDGSMSSGLKVALGDGTTTSLTPIDLSLGGSTLGASLTTADGATSAFAALGGAIGGASSGLSTLQTQADQLSAHASFVQTLGQALVSPDQDGGDSVRLMALQVSQQLSAQPSGIANQSPQSILSLFRS